MQFFCIKEDPQTPCIQNYCKEGTQKQVFGIQYISWDFEQVSRHLRKIFHEEGISLRFLWKFHPYVMSMSSRPLKYCICLEFILDPSAEKFVPSAKKNLTSGGNFVCAVLKFKRKYNVVVRFIILNVELFTDRFKNPCYLFLRTP